MSKSTGPVVVLFGATGGIGKRIIGPFVEALDNGRLQELRLPTRNSSNNTMQGFAAKGAKVFEIDFQNKLSLEVALTGAHIVISLLGTGPGSEASNEILLRAMVHAGIYTYFPSEFGTNHERISPDLDHPAYARKKAHFRQAKKMGLNPIAVLCGDILEDSFGPWLGFDNDAEVWTIFGDGNIPVAMTSIDDLGHFAVEAALLAFSTGNKIPDALEVCSVQQTLIEYAKCFDKVAGRETKFIFKSVEEAKKEYKETQAIELTWKILFSQGVYDYTNSEGNDILNPGGKRWKLKTIQDYALEVGGRPWTGGRCPWTIPTE